jgi:hypothetical protein
MVHVRDEGGMVSESLDRRLRIIESGYGREHGWFLEHHGMCIAVLDKPKWVDLFWTTYRIEPATDDPNVLEMLRSNEFWMSGDYVLRNRGFRDEIVDRAFGSRGPRADEITIRGLYIAIPEPTFWESFRCFWRLRQARRRLEACEGLQPPTPLAT